MLTGIDFTDNMATDYQKSRIFIRSKSENLIVSRIIIKIRSLFYFLYTICNSKYRKG